MELSGMGGLAEWAVGFWDGQVRPLAGEADEGSRARQ